MADGHRVRTRRRFAAAGGALAAAAAIAIAYGAVADLPGREVLPAGQQQEQKSEEKVAEILGDRYAVGVKPAASGTGVTATTYSVNAGKRTALESWDTDGKAISLAPKGANDGPLLGVAPVEGHSFSPVGDLGPLVAMEGRAPAGGTPMKLQVLSAMFVLPTQKHTAESLKVRWSNGATTTGGTVANPTPGWTFAFTDRKQGQNDGRGEIVPTSVEWTDESGTIHREPVKVD